MVPEVKKMREFFLAFRAIVSWKGFAILFLFDAQIELTLKSVEKKICLQFYLNLFSAQNSIEQLNFKVSIKDIEIMRSLHLSKLLIFDVATWLQKDYKFFTSAYILQSKKLVILEKVIYLTI